MVSILIVKGPAMANQGLGAGGTAIPGPSSLATRVPLGGVSVEVHPCSVREAPLLLWGISVFGSSAR